MRQPEKVLLCVTGLRQFFLFSLAEILSALIRGAKHWPFDMVSSMWSWVVPLIRTALEKITVETIVDWGTCFATASESRDPTAIHWMMEVLLEEPIR